MSISNHFSLVVMTVTNIISFRIRLKVIVSNIDNITDKGKKNTYRPIVISRYVRKYSLSFFTFLRWMQFYFHLNNIKFKSYMPIKFIY